MTKKCLCQSCGHYRKCGARNVSPNVCVENCSGYSGRSQGLVLRRIISTVEDGRENL